MVGFTPGCEVARYAGENSPAVEDDTIVGPNIYSSFRLITMTGGHADVHNLPLATVLHPSAHRTPMRVTCECVPDCL
jgi:hypothetical protein